MWTGREWKKLLMESIYHRPKNLLIIADDLGLAESINDGIFFLLKEGKINGASLMANGEAFDDAVAKYLEAGLLNIGVHLVLVEEKPLSGMSLPKNHKMFFIKYLFGLIKLSEIEKELRTQLQKVINAGINPQFLNSHQHLHLLPGIMNVVVNLAREYKISRIRIVNEPVDFFGGKLFRKVQLLFLNFLSWLAKKKIRKAGLQYNDFFVGFINAGDLNIKDLRLAKKLTKMYPEKVIELGCHPGFESQELVEKYGHWRYNWEKEVEVLKRKNDEDE